MTQHADHNELHRRLAASRFRLAASRLRNAPRSLPPSPHDDPTTLDWRQACYRWAWDTFGLSYHAPEMYYRRRVELYHARKCEQGFVRRGDTNSDAYTEALQAVGEAESNYNRSVAFISDELRAQVDEIIESVRGV